MSYAIIFSYISLLGPLSYDCIIFSCYFWSLTLIVF